jgi:hypothetical protein
LSGIPDQGPVIAVRSSFLERLFQKMCVHMKFKGFHPVAIEPGFCDPASGELLQVDGISRR